MNWGYKILIVYLAFVAGIVLMVFKSANQKVDLVTTDYYARELKYQERIDAIKRTRKLSSPVQYEVVDRKIVIHFPEAFTAKQLSGTVLLYCPSDDGKDLKQDFIITGGTVTIALPEKSKGAYELQINWQAANDTYYFEDKLFL